MQNKFDNHALVKPFQSFKPANKIIWRMGTYINAMRENSEHIFKTALLDLCIKM
jgi:hypothetical protein